jgi:hypothetical protein
MTYQARILSLTDELRDLFRSGPPPFDINSRTLQHGALPDTVDPVSLSLLATYVRCLTLPDPDLSWNAQIMFHEAQLARSHGGTMAMKLGSRLRAFLGSQELDVHKIEGIQR